MKTIERHNLVVKMRAQGATIAEIISAVGLCRSGVIQVLSDNRYNITDRDPPKGLSVKTAHLLHTGLGIWPAPEDAPELSERRMDIIRVTGMNRRRMKELEEWIAAVSTDQA